MVAGPSALDAAGDRLLHPSAEVRRVDRREAERLRLDLLEMREGAGGIWSAGAHHPCIKTHETCATRPPPGNHLRSCGSHLHESDAGFVVSNEEQ
jgi:hypothetical protein